MKVVVDRSKCAGIGICEMYAPEVFEVTDDGQVNIHTNDLAIAVNDAVREAIDSCPTGALRLSADE